MQFQRNPVGGAILFTLFGILPSAAPAQSVPQPAIDACATLSEGESCSFVTPNGDESGMCAVSDSQLACSPDSTSSSDTSTGTTGTTTPSDLGTLIGTTAGTLPDTGQSYCYDTAGSAVSCPASGESLYGQDAQYQGNAMSYTDNGDGTISDNVTGLMWQQTTDANGDGTINASDKLSYSGAQSYCDALTLAGHDDWRVPDIKQAYSLIHFDGEDVSSYDGTDTTGLVPFIDTDYFHFGYGDTNAGERIIDAQYATTTRYVSTTMNGDETMFGVNFADGRIKGYPVSDRMSGTDKTFYVQCVRGSESYGQNRFTDNGDGTISDAGSGLMWAQNDSGSGLDWEQALAWVEESNADNHLGYSDWRLPNVKELQHLLDYGRSPDTDGTAAIDPLFNASAFTNEGGAVDYPYYWSSTTHIGYGDVPGANAAYLSFGRALGYFEESWLDVHGAGAQRSDPKRGDPADYPTGHGPQGDAIRIYNHVRLVRSAESEQSSDIGVTTQCSLYDTDAATLSLNCLDVEGSTYLTPMAMVSSSPLRFAVNESDLQSISGPAGSDCAVYPYGEQQRLRVNCVTVESAAYWAELERVSDSDGIEFEVVEYGSR